MTKPGQPKVQVHGAGAAAEGETPSKQLVTEAQQEVVIKDSRGRAITLKKPTVLAQFRIVKVMGESATNQAYMAMVLPLIFVTKIEDDVIYFPKSESEVEAIITRLDEEGVIAVAQGVQEHWGASDPEADKTAIKK